MNKKILLLFSMLVVIVLSGCDDMLDKIPQTSRTEAVTFYKPNDYMLAVNYFYTWLPALYTTGTGIIQRDYDADIACEASSTISNISDSSYGTSPTDSRYSNYFEHIRAINEVFANEYKIEDKSSINQYLAEAYFFRAYYSFLMFADYGPLTIVKSVQDVDSPELYAARNTRDEFADFIISDLETAISLEVLPSESELRGTTSEGRITSGAANALLARVCLFEASWQKYHENNASRASTLFAKAISSAKKVMDDTSYELFYDSRLGAESYRYMFTLETVAQTNPANITKSANHEYIFRQRFSDDASGNYLYTINADKPFKCVATRKMAEMHLAADGSIATFDYKASYTSFLENKDPRFGLNFESPNSYGWCYSSGRVDWKGGAADSTSLRLRPAPDLGFPSRKWVTERTVGASNWGIDIPIIRLAEIYLIYAEAKCELEGSITDADLDISINLLRDRVGMVHLSNSSIPSGSTILAEIRRERAVELYLEGFRLSDIIRWGTASKEMSQSLEYLYMGNDSAFLKHRTDNGSNIGMPSPESLSSDGFAIKQINSKRAFEDKHYLRPIPTSQIELNHKLLQNPGWN